MIGRDIADRRAARPARRRRPEGRSIPHVRDHHRRKPAETGLACRAEQAVGALAAEGAALDDAKRDATILALKEQEDAGIDVVGDGEQSRQHFVHGFLERVDGIDFAHKVEMGIRADRYKAMVPQVVGPVRLKGRVHQTEARIARAHTRRKLKFTLPGPMTIVRHDRRPPLWRQGQDGDGLRRAAEPGGARAGEGRRRHHPVRRAGLQRVHGRGDGMGHRRAGARGAGPRSARRPCTSATATASRPTSTGRRRSARSGANTRRSSRRWPRAASGRSRSSAATPRCRCHCSAC